MIFQSDPTPRSETFFNNSFHSRVINYSYRPLTSFWDKTTERALKKKRIWRGNLMHARISNDSKIRCG